MIIFKACTKYYNKHKVTTYITDILEFIIYPFSIIGSSPVWPINDFYGKLVNISQNRIVLYFAVVHGGLRVYTAYNRLMGVISILETEYLEYLRELMTWELLSGILLFACCLHGS